MCEHISMLSFSLFLLPSSLSFYIPDSNPVLPYNDQVRERHLYTDNERRGLFLEITPDGRVTGSSVQTPLSVLELKSVQVGLTVIKGVSSSLYLCIDSSGQLRGQSLYTEADCTFRELLLADGYTRFLSSHHQLPVSLSSKVSTEQNGLPFSRFLPMRSDLLSGSLTENTAENQQKSQLQLNMGSDDPLRMVLTGVYSPQFSMER
ncbi:fibroblast growth factor 21 [Esox lucius]|uniref:Fibroblast growth factor n=1 Tax=Esox lucius TaxID=8010 RepID=A0A3P8ZNP8_ESOLU|nr:fibroblast growth factor 21 [Esox lucius]